MESKQVRKVLWKATKRVAIFLEWESTKRTPVARINWWLLRASQRSFIREWYQSTIRNSRYYWLFVHEWTKYMKWRPWMRQAVEENEVEINNQFNKWLEIYFRWLTK